MFLVLASSIGVYTKKKVFREIEGCERTREEVK